MKNKSIDWDSIHMNPPHPMTYKKKFEFKAQTINDFIGLNNIQTIFDLGCGDGSQIELINVPQYFGVDSSQTAINKCISKFSNDNTKSFKILSDFKKTKKKYELGLSLDVLQYLNDDEFLEYLTTLFKYSSRYIIIYSPDFTNRIAHSFPEWNLIKSIDNLYPKKKYPNTGSDSSFWIFEKING